MFSHLRLCGHKLSTCDFLKTFSKICFTSRNEKNWLKPNLSMFQRLKTSLKKTISLTPMDYFVNYIHSNWGPKSSWTQIILFKITAPFSDL